MANRALGPLMVIFDGFSGDCRLADVRFYPVSVQPGPTRYDRLAANYLAFVQLASIRLWLAAHYEATPCRTFPVTRSPLRGPDCRPTSCAGPFVTVRQRCWITGSTLSRGMIAGLLFCSGH